MVCRGTLGGRWVSISRAEIAVFMRRGGEDSLMKGETLRIVADVSLKTVVWNAVT